MSKDPDKGSYFQISQVSFGAVLSVGLYGILPV
jgi:hypothetical protein